MTSPAINLRIDPAHVDVTAPIRITVNGSNVNIDVTPKKNGAPLVLIRRGNQIEVTAPPQPAIQRRIATDPHRQAYSFLSTQLSKIIGRDTSMTTGARAPITKGKRVLKADELRKGLELCNEALEHGDETSVSALRRLNHRLMFYHRKALIEYNLLPEDPSVALATAGKALAEALEMEPHLVEFDNATEKDVFKNYKAAIERQEQAYLSVINVEFVISQASKLLDGDVAAALNLISDNIAQVSLISDAPMAFALATPLVDTVLAYVIDHNAQITLKEFLDDYYGLFVEPLEVDADLAQADINQSLEGIAKKLVSISGDRDIDAAVSFLEKLKAKFPNNTKLDEILIERQQRQASPESHLARIRDMQEQGDVETAQMHAAILYDFDSQFKTSKAAWQLGIERANAQMVQVKPEYLIETMQLLDAANPENFLWDFMKQGSEEEKLLKQAMLDFANEDYQAVLGSVRPLLNQTKAGDESVSHLRERAYWLELKSLPQIPIPIGRTVIDGANEEFGDSTILAPVLKPLLV